jgi:hypothetical protein
MEHVPGNPDAAYSMPAGVSKHATLSAPASVVADVFATADFTGSDVAALLAMCSDYRNVDQLAAAPAHRRGRRRSP